MQSSIVRRSLSGFLAILLVLPAVPDATAGEPRYFAIKGAKIVTVSGGVIEGGTVVIANGLITAVGKDVAIPPEAWVIDGKELTVYPGLIDALSDLGLQAGAPRPAAPGVPAAPPAAPAAPAQPPRVIRGPQDRPATTPWLVAADELRTDSRIENWRNTGITTTLSTPRAGIFAGQGAVVNFRTADVPGEMVVKTPAALYVALSGAGGGYPTSLMGNISYVKQLLLDVSHYAAANAAYRANPRGKERPAYDRAAETMAEILGSGRPVLLPATTPAQVHRALALAEQFKLNAVIYGAQQGYDAAAAIAAKKTPVIVSLRWPEKERDADPEAADPLRVLRFRDRAPSTPAALEQAGVKFAFYSDGITNPKDILKNAKKAIDAGLAPDAALRAFTLSAAEILGVADRLGSLEAGKIANLVVADGDLFNEKSKIKMVFVDGEKFEVRESARPQEPPKGTLTGKWTLKVTTPEGTRDASADLTMSPDGGVTGSVTSEFGISCVTEGFLSGDKFSFKIIIQMGAQATPTTFSGTLEGSTMKGTVSVGPESFEFTGTRPDGGRAEAEAGGAL